MGRWCLSPWFEGYTTVDSGCRPRRSISTYRPAGVVPHQRHLAYERAGQGSGTRGRRTPGRSHPRVATSTGTSGSRDTDSFHVWSPVRSRSGLSLSASCHQSSSRHLRAACGPADLRAHDVERLRDGHAVRLRRSSCPGRCRTAHRGRDPRSPGIARVLVGHRGSRAVGRGGRPVRPCRSTSQFWYRV